MGVFWRMLGYLVVALVIVFGLLHLLLDQKQLEGLARVAPLATSIVALLAAAIALSAMYVQRDTAQRRAAIDFFLKTETDDGLIDAYAKFISLSTEAELTRIIAKPDLNYADTDYRALRKWLNLCELIAVGVRHDGFSKTVALEYWGDVLPDTYNSSLKFIEHIRKTPSLGGPKTFYDLEMLAKEWTEQDSNKKT